MCYWSYILVVVLIYCQYIFKYNCKKNAAEISDSLKLQDSIGNEEVSTDVKENFTWGV